MGHTSKATRTKYGLKRTKERKEVLVKGIICKRCQIKHHHEGRYCYICEPHIMKGPY